MRNQCIHRWQCIICFIFILFFIFRHFFSSTNFRFERWARRCTHKGTIRPFNLTANVSRHLIATAFNYYCIMCIRNKLHFVAILQPLTHSMPLHFCSRCVLELIQSFFIFSLRFSRCMFFISLVHFVCLWAHMFSTVYSTADAVLLKWN